MTTFGKNIKFNYQTPIPGLKNKTDLKEFLYNLIKTEGKAIKIINYIFCDDAFLLNLNQKFLKHDTYTDIITFEYNIPKQPIHSDIYISVVRIKENSERLNVPFLTELKRVMIHGALHLSGYKDKSASQKKIMRQKEDYYLDLLRVSRET